MSLNDWQINKSWTLFLDRDGVLNHQIIDNYVTRVEDFRWIDGVLDAIQFFSQTFGRIVIVTNQQGISRGIMTEEQLHILHDYMLDVIKLSDGRIDKIYFAPQLSSENSYYRKPGVGMGLHAKRDFPEIDFSRSVIIGDSETDIEFGIKLGMKTILLTNGRNLSSKADYIFENLSAVSNELKKFR